MNEIEISDKLKKSGIFSNFYKTKALFLITEYRDENNVFITIGFTNHGKKYELTTNVCKNPSEQMSIIYDFCEVSNFAIPSASYKTIIKISNTDLIDSQNLQEDLKKCLKISDSDSKITTFREDVIFDNFAFLARPRTVKNSFYIGLYHNFTGTEISIEEYTKTFVIDK